MTLSFEASDFGWKVGQQPATFTKYGITYRFKEILYEGTGEDRELAGWVYSQVEDRSVTVTVFND